MLVLRHHQHSRFKVKSAQRIHVRSPSFNEFMICGVYAGSMRDAFSLSLPSDSFFFLLQIMSKPMSAQTCDACHTAPATKVANPLTSHLCASCRKKLGMFVAKLRGIKSPVSKPTQDEYDRFIASLKETTNEEPASTVNDKPRSIRFSSDDEDSPSGTPVNATDCACSSSDTEVLASSSASEEESDSSDTILHEEEDDDAPESFSADASDASEEESPSSDSDSPNMENISNEMDASSDAPVVSASPVSVNAIQPKETEDSDTVHAEFSEGWDDVIEYSGSDDEEASAAHPVGEQASPVPVKATPVIRPPSIKFAGRWLEDVYKPIAPSITIQGDHEYVKKMRFAFLNKVLPSHKAFHAIVSSIERNNAYHEFLIPFDCYSNHKLDKAARDTFINEHGDKCDSSKDGKLFAPFTGCGFNILKTGLALFDFDFKTYTYTYKSGLVVGSPVELKAIEDTSITDAFFDKLMAEIDCSKVLDVLTKSNGHHIYCRWDGSLKTLTTNTVDKGCRMCIGKSATEKPMDGEYREYWCELDIKASVRTDDRNAICPLPGTVCLNKLGKEATYRLNPRSTESNIDNLWSFKEVNAKIASVYAELDYIAWDKRRFDALPVADKASAIKRDPEASEQEKMDAEALAWLNNPCEDEDVLDIRDTIDGSALIDDSNSIVFTEELVDAIIKGFEGVRIHGHHSVKANRDAHIKAEPSQYALKTAIYSLTLDETIRTKLLDGIYNAAALTEHAKSGWSSTISFNDKEWSVEVQRNALISITAWIRSNNEVFYNATLANKLYRPGKDFFDDRTHMFTWQEFQERLDSGAYSSVSTLMHDLAKVLAINTLASGGRGYFVKRWFKEPKLGERPRYNDFTFDAHNGPYVASMLDTTITIPTTAAEREHQRMGKRKVTEFKEVHVGSLLKKDIYRKYLASFRGSVVWSDDEHQLSTYKPPAGNYNKEIVEFFIAKMLSRVVNPKAWEEEFASHAYRIQREGNAFIPKYFMHVDPNGHAGKSFNAAAFAQMYGERFSNAAATVANMIDDKNAWMFNQLYINFEEVQYSNGRGFDIRDKLKQLTTKSGSKRDMYKVAETAEHKAIISINTNQKDLYGLVNGDPADLRRLVVIEFKEATPEVINEWESVINKTIHDPDFGYSLFHYMAYDYKIPDWFDRDKHCTPDIRDEYIRRAKEENENQISRWLSWLMAKPIADDNYNRESLLLSEPPDSYQNWHDDWFLRTKLSKGVGEVALQSKASLWSSFKKFCDKDCKYGQTRLYKDLREVYGFIEHKVRIYGPKSSAVHSLYIPIDKFYELRAKYGGVSQNDAADEDVLDIEPSE